MGAKVFMITDLEGDELIDERTWVFRGKALKRAWLKYSSSFYGVFTE